MSSHPKVLVEHRERSAFVYARQSSAAQVLHNRTSTSASSSSWIARAS
jgi:hypothetical protein